MEEQYGIGMVGKVFVRVLEEKICKMPQKLFYDEQRGFKAMRGCMD